MPEDLELDQSEPESTKLFGGAVTVGRALRGAFPTLRRAGIRWRYFGHQGFPWCPDCGVMVAGAAPVHRNRRKLSPGQAAHEEYHDQLDAMGELLGQLAGLLGIDTERGDNGTE